MLMELLGNLNSEPLALGCVQHFALLTRCVHEWLCNAERIGGAALEDVLAKVEFTFGLGTWCSNTLCFSI